MFDFSQLSAERTTTYWYIEYIPTGVVVYLPFRRNFEKQDYILYTKSELTIDSSSYWVEGVAEKLLRRFIKDNPHLNYEDFKVVKYEEEV